MSEPTNEPTNGRRGSLWNVDIHFVRNHNQYIPKAAGSSSCCCCRCIPGAETTAARPLAAAAGHISAVAAAATRRSLEKNKSGYLMSSVVVVVVARKRPKILDANTESSRRREARALCVQETCGQADRATTAVPLVNPTVLIL